MAKNLPGRFPHCHTVTLLLEGHVLRYETLLEVVGASHLANFVDGPFTDRGGLFLVAPPGSFKSTITDVLGSFAHTLVLSDINVQSLIKMKPHMVSGEILTIGFTDFGKLYARAMKVAANVEGILMGLVGEGFRRASFEPQTPSVSAAHCTITGGMTSAFHDQKISEWEQSGFARRFLWARYSLNGVRIIEEAQLDYRMARLSNGFVPKVPGGKGIPCELDKRDREFIDHCTRQIMYRSGGALVIAQKLYAALIWKHGRKTAREIMDDFRPCIERNGGTLNLKEVKP